MSLPDTSLTDCDRSRAPLHDEPATVITANTVERLRHATGYGPADTAIASGDAAELLAGVRLARSVGKAQRAMRRDRFSARAAARRS